MLTFLHVFLYQLTSVYKQFSYRRGTARRAMSVEILSNAAKPYYKYYLK